MRQILYIFPILLVSCGVFQPHEVQVSRTWVDTLKTSLGVPNLEQVPQDALKAKLQELTNEKFSSVRFVNGTLLATVEPVSSEVARKVGPGIIDTIISNPTPYGIVTALIALSGIGFSIYQGRQKLEEATPVVKA